MSFKVDNWGAEIANAKSLLKGVNYYRYEIPSGDTITTAGYFPKDLGLKLGDRIWVIPATKTDTDLLYTVSNVSNYGVITVSLAAGQGDTLPAQTGNAGKFLTTDGTNASWGTVDAIQVDTMPTAAAAEVGKVYQFIGTTDATYTHGYFYECVATPVYDSTVEFNPASLSGTTATCSGSDFAALVARWGTGAIDIIIKGTLTYDESGELLVFVGQDDTNTTVCTFQLYAQDYVDAGFTFTGTFQDGDVIAFTCTIEETGATYAWNRIDVQPQPAKELPTQAGNSGKFLTTNGVSPSWSAVELLPDQTGNTGKFLTTDGTDASWATISALQNAATGTNGLAVTTGSTAVAGSNVSVFGVDAGLGTTGTASDVVCVGYGAKAGYLTQSISGSVVIGSGAQTRYGNAVVIGAGASSAGYSAADSENTVVGSYANTNAKGTTCLGKGAKVYGANYAISIGSGSDCRGTNSIGIGYQANPTQTGSIQFGKGTNSEAGTVCFGLTTNGSSFTNYKLLDSNGTIPADRFASTSGLADGNYKLRLTISNGVATLSWVAE